MLPQTLTTYLLSVPFLPPSQVTLNKRAETIAVFFQMACAEFGWPSRVRFDHGTEGVEIGRLQTEHWLFVDRGSFITGRSVHNTRIESMWNHLGRTAGGVYRRLFDDLQRNRTLDPYDPAHLFALHSVFVPRLQGKSPLVLPSFMPFRSRLLTVPESRASPPSPPLSPPFPHYSGAR